MRTSVWSRIEPVDLVVAAAMTLALQAEIWFPGALGAESVTEDRLLLSVTSLAISLPLVFRRTLPWTVAVIALGAEVAQEVLSTPPEGLGQPAGHARRLLLVGSVCEAPAGYAGIALIVAASFGMGQDLADNTFVLLLLGSSWAVGVVVARRTDDLGALELRRLAATREGAEEERLRIARELHDVVAHRVSMMVVQSQLADTLLDDDPARARRAIGAVETAGREALVELRSVLGLMHDDGPTSLAPEDTELSRLDKVVDEARAGGLPVTFGTDGTPRPVPPAVALAAFRIVQESLTNVVRHAASAPTRVRLELPPRRGGDHRGGRRSSPDRARPGHGLAGMRERAAFLGGTLVTEPSPDGGLRVCAVPADTRGGPMTRAIVADDQEMVRDGLAAILDTEPDLEIVGTAADGAEAVQVARRERPDVVVMDVRMPGMDGIEATRRITAEGLARVLVLTTFDLDDYVYQAVRAGASGFLLKDAPRERLADAIRSVARGDMLVDPVVTRRLVERFAVSRARSDDRRLDVLTAREREVLVEIGRGLSNTEIAARLYVGEATVKTHVSALLRKLDLRDRVQAVILAYEAGLVSPDD